LCFMCYFWGGGRKRELGNVEEKRNLVASSYISVRIHNLQ